MPTVPEYEASSRQGLLAGIAAYSLFGFFPLYWKLISIPASQAIYWRMLLSLIVVGGIVWIREHKPLWQLFADRRVALIHLVAAVFVSGNWFVFIYAIGSDQVVEASLGYFINPLLSVALGVVVLGERLTGATKVAVALATVGVVILTINASRVPWIALLLAFSFALYGLVRKQSPRGSLDGLATELVWMAPVAIIGLGLLQSQAMLSFGDETSRVAMWFMGFITATPLLLLSIAWRALPLSLVGLLQYIAPVMQFLIGAFVFREPVGIGRWVAVAFFCAALATLSVDSRRKRTDRPQRDQEPIK